MGQSSDTPSKGKQPVLEETTTAKAEVSLDEAEGDEEGDEDTQISGVSIEDDDAAIEAERVSAQNAYAPETREPPAERGRKPTTARELILQELPHRIERDRARLRPVLNGKIAFEITDKSERLIFDWSGEQLTVSDIKESKDRDETIDCTISTSEGELLRVANGSLNPQVSMLSGKIKVKGKAALAIYIFNLIAPRQFVH